MKEVHSKPVHRPGGPRICLPNKLYTGTIRPQRKKKNIRKTDLKKKMWMLFQNVQKHRRVSLLYSQVSVAFAKQVQGTEGY